MEKEVESRKTGKKEKEKEKEKRGGKTTTRTRRKGKNATLSAPPLSRTREQGVDGRGEDGEHLLRSIPLLFILSPSPLVPLPTSNLVL